MRQCPHCQSTAVITNGHIHTGTAKFACKACGRQFVDAPSKQPIAASTKAWLALAVETRLIVGCFIGGCDEQGARGLWAVRPPVYRQCALCYTDFWRAYSAILPSKRHRRGGNGSGKTNDIERFNTTVRQRGARLVRQTLSFSKKMQHHVGAIWLFIHDHNRRQLRHRTTTSA